jgi:hypothetical protein
MKSASANYTKGKIYLNLNSLSKDGVWLTSPPYFRLEENVDLARLGKAVLETLKGSKTGVPHPKNFTDFGKDFLVAVGLKSFNQLQENTSKSCSIKINDESIEIIPYQNVGKKKGFMQLKDNPIESIFLPLNASEEAIGEGLLKGFEASFFKKEDVG